MKNYDAGSHKIEPINKKLRPIFDRPLTEDEREKFDKYTRKGVYMWCQE